MRILILNSAESWGGDQSWTRMIANLVSEKYPVLLVYKSDVVGNRYEIEKIKIPRKWNLLSVIKIISLVKSRHINLIISTKRRDYLFAGIVARYCNIKSINLLGMVKNPGFLINRLSDGFIVNSKNIRDYLYSLSAVGKEKIFLGYGKFDMHTLDSVSIQEDSLKKQFPLLITTAGRISRRKGIDLIIKAFARFHQRVQPSDAGLLIIGKGNRLSEFKKLARDLGVESRVDFLGFIPNPYPYLRMSDIYLSAPVNEGLSIGMLEAMYFGNAVISSRDGGGEDFIVDMENGILCDSVEVDLWANRLELLYRDRVLRNTLGNNAKNYVKKKFSERETNMETLNFIEKVSGLNEKAP